MLGDGPFLAQDEFVHTMYYFANEEDTIDIEQPTHTASITNHSSRQKRVREDETTPTIEPWMQCRYYQKAFHKGAHLRRHERIHTGIKPYVCMTCNRSFSRQDSLIRHEKLHNKATASDTASLALEREVTSSNSSPHDSGVVAAHVYNSPPPSHASIFETGSTAKETQGNSHTTWPYWSCSCCWLTRGRPT
jgi:hypothetical protein